MEAAGIGGAEIVAINLATELNQGDFESEVILIDGDPAIPLLEERGLKYTSLRFEKSFSWSLVRQIAAQLRQSGAAIAQGHLPRMITYSTLAGKLAHVRSVMTVHGGCEFEHPRQRLYYFACGLLSSAVVTVSESLKQELHTAARVKKSKIAVINNGIYLPDFERAADRKLLFDKYQIPPEGPLLVAVGNVREVKRYDVAIRTLAIVKSQFPGITLAIAGKADDVVSRELERLVEELEVTANVKFLGFVAEPAELYAAADVYLLSSDSEGFSIATIEAMAASLPVVVTDCGGPRDIVTSDSEGIIIPKANPEAMAQSVVTLLRDEKLRRRMGESARQSVERRFSMRACADRYRELYSKVLGLKLGAQV